MAHARTPSPSSKLSALVAICLTVFILWAAYEVLMPIALAVLLAFLLAPIVSRLERVGLPQVWAVIATVTVAFALIGGLGYVVGTQVYNLAVELPKYGDQIEKKAGAIRKFGRGDGEGLTDKIVALGERIEQASTQPTAEPPATTQSGAPVISGAAEQFKQAPLATATGTKVPPVMPVASTRPAGETPEKPLYTVALPAPLQPIELLGRYLGTLLGPLGTAGLVVIFTLFVLLEREQLRDRVISVVSGGNYTTTTTAIGDAGSRVSRYLFAMSIVNGSYGLVIGTGLWLIGLTMGGGQSFPSFVLWGVLCAILRFIPYIGPWVAAAFPIALSLVVYDGFNVFFAVLAMFVVIELLSNNLMEPWLYGSSTGLSTVAILVAAVFWTWLWGPIGLLLSTPLTVCIVVLGRYTAQLHFLDVLLSDRPALPPAVRFYQRLLANDEREATAIVREAAAEADWSHAVDLVVAPALALVRRDRRDDNLTAEDEGRLLKSIVEVQARVAERIEEADAKQSAQSGTSPAERAAMADNRPRVLAVPAHHRSEEALLTWLAVGPVLDPVSIEVGSTKTLAAQVIERVAADRPSAVVIAVVPPGGLIQARYLCRRLRRRVPDVVILVAYFGRPRHFDKLLSRLRTDGAAYVTTSIEQTQRQILAIVQRSTPDPAPPTPDATAPLDPTAAPAAAAPPAPRAASGGEPP